MQIYIISFTEAGFSLAERICLLIKEVDSRESGELDFSEVTVDCASSARKNSISLSEWVKVHFKEGNALVFIGAAGIAVRAIAPFVRDKTTDSAVLVIDEKGSFVIPILSGHIGGANELARGIARVLGATPVITTASDVNNLPAIDEFAKKNNLVINDMQKAKEFAVKVLHESRKASEKNCPPELDSGSRPQFTISLYIKNDILNLIPRCVVLGIGCKKGKSAEELQSFVCETLKKHKIDYRSVEEIASIDLKKDENAILSLSESLKRPFVTFSAEELNAIPQKVSHSDFVSEITGTDNVCERAVWAAGASEILIPKTAKDGMTLAAGVRKIEVKIPEGLKSTLVSDFSACIICK
ncbi:MAG: cobalt-precorrin 5A hydrolase [Treponema sp.]|nr:cobalt-precorrin 5A hydrolase [Treponema sp.]